MHKDLPFVLDRMGQILVICYINEKNMCDSKKYTLMFQNEKSSKCTFLKEIQVRNASSSFTGYHLHTAVASLSAAQTPDAQIAL